MKLFKNYYFYKLKPRCLTVSSIMKASKQVQVRKTKFKTQKIIQEL